MIYYFFNQRHGAQCIGGWVGSRAGVDGYGKSPTHPPPPRAFFYSWIIQPVASRYTDWAIPVQEGNKIGHKILVLETLYEKNICKTKVCMWWRNLRGRNYFNTTVFYLITHTNTCTYILIKESKIYIKTLSTLLHVSITRSSSGSIHCSLLKL